MPDSLEVILVESLESGEKPQFKKFYNYQNMFRSLLFISLFCFSALAFAQEVADQYPYSESALQQMARDASAQIPFDQLPKEVSGDRAKFAEMIYSKMLESRALVQAMPREQRLETYKKMNAELVNAKTCTERNVAEGVEKPTEPLAQAKVFDTEVVPVLGHFTGKQSTALPSTDQLIKFQAEAKKRKEQKSQEVYVEPELDPATTEIKTVVMPDCIASGSAVEPIGNAGSATAEALANLEGQETTFDLLFVQHMPRDLDPAEVFGKNTKVVEVPEDFSHPMAQAAIVMGIECLPTRLQKTATERKWLEGKIALYNYDKDKFGVLHPLVSSKLDIKKDKN